MKSYLKTVAAADFQPSAAAKPLDAETLAAAEAIVNNVRENGVAAVRQYAAKFDGLANKAPLLLGRAEMQAAAERLDAGDLALLERVADRIRKFAQAQLDSLAALTTEVPGGQAGHSIVPVNRAGCYAPAGRYALPSTVLMTVVPAVVAGCGEVFLATPSRSDLMLAAAYVAGADRVLAVGGAQAIAAMAYGIDEMQACDVICGPGNRWVTAAKKIVSGDCGIDMLAGPSELVLVADESANPETVAADLLAQAEHDTDARAFLVTTSESFADLVQSELVRQLKTLPTAETAVVALGNGAVIIAESIEAASNVCNALAPEHLELHLADAQTFADQISNAGCIFVGHQSAEVFGDYGVGPNHTLPTAGTARFSAGLNVFTFIRVRTWLKLTSAPQTLIDDTARLAELEGLIGHQQAALKRNCDST
jgi:phosphoribosyl-ATP pyrophosphohydrolase/phosphoribosyl-AMP cyclohydrolase/histidinol dehydrogenase